MPTLSSSNSPPSRNRAFLALHIPNLEIQHYELTEKVTTAGRSTNNVLEIPDTNMSRRHFIIERRDDGQFIVTDCNSSNGTIVNSERIISVELENGDWIEAGSTRIQFLTVNLDLNAGGQDLATGPSAQPSQNSELGVVLGEREDLKRLLEINKELNQEHELRPLLERIIDSAIELIAAERGYLILAGRADMKIEIARGLTGQGRRGTTVSKQICSEVLDTGRVILTSNASEDESYGRFESVVEHNIQSILCVPFKIKDTVLGVIYLDNEQRSAFSNHDVQLLEAFSDQAAVAIDNARLIHGMKKKERLEQEMKTAAEIQAKLLPRTIPTIDGLELAGYMRSAKEVGGDYYDFVELSNGSALICIGDVSGKGVPAGLIMASARSMIRALAGRVQSTKELLIDLNRIMSQDLEMDMFMSMLLIRYDAISKTLTYTGAGHEHLVIYRQRTGTCETKKAGGVVLGVTPDLTRYVKEEFLDLDVGDSVYLYTDGVTEAFNKHQEQYQLERFVESCERHGSLRPEQSLPQLMRDLTSFAGKTPQSDDITIVVLQKK